MFQYRVPSVLDKDKGEYVFINEVNSGSKRNLICFNCKGSMVAVHKEGNKQKPHFRHKKINCGFSIESYVHWLSKMIFYEIDYIKLPSINFEYLYNNYWDDDSFFKEKTEKIFKNYNLPLEFRDLSNFNTILRLEDNFYINKFRIENLIKSEEGNFRPDLIIDSKEKSLIVEPFYSHKLEERTIKLILLHDCSTISINLNNFIEKKEFNFTKEELKEFIINDIDSKEWKHLNAKFRDILFLEFRKKIENYIENRKRNISEYINDKSRYENVLHAKLENLYNEKEKLRNDEFKYQKQIDEIMKFINPIRNEISIKVDEIRKTKEDIQNEKSSLIEKGTNFFDDLNN